MLLTSATPHLHMHVHPYPMAQRYRRITRRLVKGFCKWEKQHPSIWRCFPCLIRVQTKILYLYVETFLGICSVSIGLRFPSLGLLSWGPSIQKNDAGAFNQGVFIRKTAPTWGHGGETKGRQHRKTGPSLPIKERLFTSSHHPPMEPTAVSKYPTS